MFHFEQPESFLLSMSDTTLLGSSPPSGVPAQILLSPGEIIRTSGKFQKPTKIPGKNYSKDEVVIRNSDSGKGKNISYFHQILLKFLHYEYCIIRYRKYLISVFSIIIISFDFLKYTNSFIIIKKQTKIIEKRKQ